MYNSKLEEARQVFNAHSLKIIADSNKQNKRKINAKKEFFMHFAQTKDCISLILNIKQTLTSIANHGYYDANTTLYFIPDLESQKIIENYFSKDFYDIDDVISEYFTTYFNNLGFDISVRTHRELFRDAKYQFIIDYYISWK